MSRRKRVIRPNRLPLHVFTASGAQDYRGIGICTCGSAVDASVHRLPEVPPEVAEAERRRTGEAD